MQKLNMNENSNIKTIKRSNNMEEVKANLKKIAEIVMVVFINSGLEKPIVELCGTEGYEIKGYVTSDTFVNYESELAKQELILETLKNSLTAEELDMIYMIYPETQSKRIERISGRGESPRWTNQRFQDENGSRRHWVYIDPKDIFSHYYLKVS